MAKHYLRVWFGPREQKPVNVEMSGFTGRFLVGYEVNWEADRVKPAGADERLRMIEVGAIRSIQPMSLSPIYAMLVYAGPPTSDVQPVLDSLTGRIALDRGK